jgi:hypothetical protein
VMPQEPGRSKFGSRRQANCVRVRNAQTEWAIA